MKRIREDTDNHEEQNGTTENNNIPSRVLHLNVGGTTTAVLRRTLTSVEGSMLASRFSGRWDESLEKDRDGNFFIDQPIELFMPMLNYLRAKFCETALAPPVTSPEFESEKQQRDFIRMVEHFGMTPGIYPTVMEICRGEPASAQICRSPHMSVTSNSWATFTLETRGHKRPIISFSVVLGKVERAQIGWVRDRHFVKKLRPGITRESEMSDSPSVLIASALDGLSADEGTVIRCENKGERWLVNGQLVASSIALEETFQCPPDLQQYSLIPAFSGKGEWTVCEVILDAVDSNQSATISHSHL